MIIRCVFAIGTLLVNLALSPLVHADNLHISIADPEWTLLLNNDSLAQRSASLRPAELSFSRQLQPLLQARQYQDIAALFAKRPLHDDSPALQVLRAQVLLSLQQYREAEAALNAALKQQPTLALAHQALSLVLMQQQRYDEARTHLVAAVNLGVADAQVYGQLGFINLKTQHAASAIAGYQQALLLEPDNPQWQQGLLYALIQSQAWSQAQAMLEQLLQTQPNNSSLWLQRAQLALSRQDQQQALSSMEVALRLGDSNSDNLLLAAQLHFNAGSAARGVDLLLQALSRSNEQQKWAEPAIQASSWLSQSGQWQELRSLLSKLDAAKNQLKPQQQAILALAKAKLAQQDKQPQQVLAALQQAVKADPMSGDALMALAQWYDKQGNNDLASLYYSRASTLDSVKLAALQAQAQLEINRQQYQTALNLLQQVQQLAPQRQDIQHNIRSLQQLVRQQGS